MHADARRCTPMHEVYLFNPPPFKGGVGGGWGRAIVMNRRNADPPSILPCKGGRFFTTLREVFPHPSQGAKDGAPDTQHSLAPGQYVRPHRRRSLGLLSALVQRRIRCELSGVAKFLNVVLSGVNTSKRVLLLYENPETQGLSKTAHRAVAHQPADQRLTKHERNRERQRKSAGLVTRTDQR
jgi:hypothetical protein